MQAIDDKRYYVVFEQEERIISKVCKNGLVTFDYFNYLVYKQFHNFSTSSYKIIITEKIRWEIYSSSSWDSWSTVAIHETPGLR